MFKDISSYSIVLILLLFPLKLFAMNNQTACDLLKLPHECSCPRNRQITVLSLNETRLRCRQLTELSKNHQWSAVTYDRLTFDTFNDNLTLHRFAFADIIVRTLRFNVQNLFLLDHAFDNAYIGQLVVTYQDTYGQINFELNSQIFYGTVITNLLFKSIDFQIPISELIFSNANIHTLIIQSSKFHGFTNQNPETISQNSLKIKHDQFLDYDYTLPSNPKQLQNQTVEPNDDNSSLESDQTVTIDITLLNSQVYIKIYQIISSINTTNLTANYFPNNFKYNQLEEIELSFNHITYLNAHTFRYLKQFQGKLILSNNQIKYLDPYSLADLSLIKNLSLAKNFIQNLTSKHFQELNQLEELNLSYNQIYQLNNNTFEYLTNLQILYLNFNPIEFIHADTFLNLTQLKQIHFQGVQFTHSIDQVYFQWIWNLASLHVIHLLKTDFDLSDVAFCILSRYNQTLFHLSRQHSCSCNIHYFNRNQDFIENTSISTTKYHTNYLRLTPICNENDTESNFEQQINQTDFILQGLEDKCNYKLMFLDCDAMTTTTTSTEMTALLTKEPDTETRTIEPPVSTTPIRWTPTTTRRPLSNMKKLFTVLATLAAITIGAIILVFFYYRFKTMLKRKRKKKNFVELQRQLSSPATNNYRSTVPRYASSDMLSSIHSGHIFGGKIQSEALIESSSSQPLTIYKNIDAVDKDPIENLIEKENLQQDKIIEMQTINQY